MIAYNFDSIIDSESSSGLIDFIWQEEDGIIYFNSDGGDTPSRDAIIHSLNNNLNKQIALTYNCTSCALDIVIRTNNKLLILPSFELCGIHLSSVGIDLSNTRDIHSAESQQKYQLEKSNKLQLEYWIDKTDENEFRKISEGGIVYWGKDRFCKFLDEIGRDYTLEDYGIS